MSKFLACFSIIAIVTCSAPTMAHKESIPSPVAKARPSFSFIMMTIKISPKDCVYLGGKKGDIKHQTCEVGNLPDKFLRSYGSGAVVAQGAGYSYVLTAAHVCSYPRVDKKIVGHKIITVTLKPIPKVRDVMGNEFKSEIFSLDSKNDLCILKVDGIFGKPLKIAKEMVQVPSRIYSYGAPLAVNHPGMVLFFEGFSSGYKYDPVLERKDVFYTLPIRSGSSGSSVLNSKGEIIGVVHTAIVQMENIAMSSSLESIKNIMKSIPEIYYERVGP